MKKKLTYISFFLLLIFGMAFLFQKSSLFVRAIDPIDDIQNQINDIEHLRQLSIAATTPLESTVNDLQSKINKAQADIKTAQNQEKSLATTITQRELDLASQYKIFAQRVAQRYKRAALSSPLLTFINNSDAADLTRDLVYRQAAEEQDNKVIHQIGSEIKGLEQQKLDLETRQKRLAALSADLDKQAAYLQTQIAGAKAYQANLSSQIASLTAKQQEILNARSGSVITSVGDVPLADDSHASPNYDPGFKPAYGVFTFGAYTHRKGMSQYGAKGRAQEGQSYKEILKAYYGKEPENKDTGGSINVVSNGSMDFETKYLYGVAEMPASFPKEALKAQAVAARSYAYRYKQSGEAICVVDGCPGQVFLKSKSDNPPAAWKEAVDETKGQVISDVTTFFSSATGGYGNPVGWDTKCGNKSCWTGDAYEKIANTPWFYRGWYRQNYYNTSASCGRSSPWLNQQEMSDILNAWLVRKNPNGADVSRIQPITINQCNVGGGGGNPYSMDELRDLANNAGGAVTSISGVSASNNDQGQTTTVTFQTNKGSLTIPGSDFKETFNLRAPGYLSIPQKGFSFFNVEYKP